MGSLPVENYVWKKGMEIFVHYKFTSGFYDLTASRQLNSFWEKGHLEDENATVPLPANFKLQLGKYEKHSPLPPAV